MNRKYSSEQDRFLRHLFWSQKYSNEHDSYLTLSNTFRLQPCEEDDVLTAWLTACVESSPEQYGKDVWPTVTEHLADVVPSIFEVRMSFHSLE